MAACSLEKASRSSCDMRVLRMFLFHSVSLQAAIFLGVYMRHYPVFSLQCMCGYLSLHSWLWEWPAWTSRCLDVIKFSGTFFASFVSVRPACTCQLSFRWFIHDLVQESKWWRDNANDIWNPAPWNHRAVCLYDVSYCAGTTSEGGENACALYLIVIVCSRACQANSCFFNTADARKYCHGSAQQEEYTIKLGKRIKIFWAIHRLLWISIQLFLVNGFRILSLPLSLPLCPSLFLRNNRENSPVSCVSHERWLELHIWR